jgi:3',5'-cyclic-AMP phosphodiesterase
MMKRVVSAFLIKRYDPHFIEAPMINFKRYRLLCILFLLCFSLSIVLSVQGEASTLYERSLKKFQDNVNKLSSKDFVFVVLGDSRDNDAIYKKSLAMAATFNPLFILHTGDLSNRGSKKELEHFLEIVQTTIPDIPLFVVVGNHEIVKVSKNIFKQTIGPLDYVLDSAKLNIRVIVLDNADYTLKPQQLDYLRQQLNNKRDLNFVAIHIPPKTGRWTWHSFKDSSADFMQILSANKVTLAFCGHIHQFDEDEINGVKYIITGGAGAPLNRWFFPGDPVYHIIVVKVKNGTVSYDLIKIQN